MQHDLLPWIHRIWLSFHVGCGRQCFFHLRHHLDIGICLVSFHARPLVVPNCRCFLRNHHAPTTYPDDAWHSFPRRNQLPCVLLLDVLSCCLFVMSFSCSTTSDQLTHPRGERDRVGNVPAKLRVFGNLPARLGNIPAFVMSSTFHFLTSSSEPSFRPERRPMVRLTTACSGFTMRKGSQLKPAREAMWSTSAL